MKIRLSSIAATLALLILSLTACPALADSATATATANATIVAPNTSKITAPYSGTLMPFDAVQGDSVAEGEVLFTFDTQPVYATHDGTVAAVFAVEGDDASGVASQYGALAVIEPEHPLYIDADTSDAYNDNDNRYIHAGEVLTLKCGNEKGTGLVTSVSGENYVVQVLTGNFELDDTVRCYRESSASGDSATGRGKVKRYADTLVNVSSGRIAAVHVKPGDSVSVGDLLFEVVDALSAKDAPRELTSPSDGAITLMNTLSGAQVYRGQLLCEVADLSTLELSAEVDELDLGRVRVGESLSYTLDAFPGETFNGVVTQIRPVGQTRQNATYFDVRITLPEDMALLPGMNATVMLSD